MRSRSQLPITPLLLAIAAMLPAGEAPTPPPAVPPNGGTTSGQAEVAAEAKYVEALAHYRAGEFAEALELVNLAVAAYPPHAGAQKLRNDVLAVLSNRANRFKMAEAWFSSMQDVRTQETIVRLSALLTRADKEMEAGDYDAAELDYDRVEIGIRSFPYRFDWGDMPKQVAAKRVDAQEKVRLRQAQRQSNDRKMAAALAHQQADLQAQALKLKVDELLRRAKSAFDRKDFRRAEVEAYAGYELDRRREDARELYLAARREGHYMFDVAYREDSIEGLARVAEEVHKSLIPQTEVLVYPEDWQRRAQRQAVEIGSNADEPWRKAIEDKLKQRITVQFVDTPLEEAVKTIRGLTGLNIVVATAITAAGGKPVSLDFKDTGCEEVLKWIMQTTDLKMAIQNGAIQISNEEIHGATKTKLYDISDLTMKIEDFKGIDISYASGGAGGGAGGLLAGGGGGAGGTGATSRTPEELMEFVKKNVSPTSWDPAKNIDISVRSGTLFVSQTVEGHHLVDELLKSLRNQGSLEVNVSVRVLLTMKGFYEEIGVDWTNAPVNFINASTANGFIQQGGSTAARGAGYAINGGLNNRLPGNNTSNAYGITPLITPGSPPAKGLILEGAMNVGSILNVEQVNAILSAAEDETDVKVLNQPELTCFNGQRATATFIHQFAYIKSYTIQSSNYDPVIDVLSYGDVLDVRPIISSDHKYITMEVHPQSKTLDGVFTEYIVSYAVQGSGTVQTINPAVAYPIELPNVGIQTLSSTIMLPDRGSLLIGGFNQSLRQRTQTGVPFLSHIPFIGRLFSRNGVYDEARRTFYLLTAKIIDLNEQEKGQ
ncbi:MAG: hypothetical protein AAB263_04860 [Planctomycetota bacterium]